MPDKDRDEFLAKVRADPLWLHAKLWPNDKLWGAQEDILRAVFANDYVTVRASNGVGKTYIAARTIVLFALAYPGCEIVTTATTWDQVEKVLWKEIHAAHGSAKIPLGGKLLDTEWQIGTDGWMAYGISTNKQERFLGHHSLPVLVVIDEASGVPAMIDEAARSLLTSEGCKLLKIGNPIDPAGHFYDSFLSPLFTKFSISAFDSPNFTAFGITEADIISGGWASKIKGPLPAPRLTTPKWVAERYIEYGPDSPWVECFVRGNFPTTAVDTLISLSEVMAAQARAVEPDNRRAIGVDVARYGLCETVIVGYNQGNIEILDTARGQDTMKTAEKAAEYRQQYQQGWPGKVQIGVDDIGVGGGVTDRLAQLGEPVAPFAASERSRAHGKFNSLTAWAWWEFRAGIRAGLMSLPRDEKLTAQLVGRKYRTAPDGQIELERKEEMEKRGLKSPDRADAAIIAHWTAMAEHIPQAPQESRELKQFREIEKYGIRRRETARKL